MEQSKVATHARVLAALTKWKQQRLVELLTTPIVDEALVLQQQLLHFETWYKGGLDGYFSTATQLFRELEAPSHQQQNQEVEKTVVGPNPAIRNDGEECLPSNPFASVNGQHLSEIARLGSSYYQELEAIGLNNIDKMCCVIVAGGLGERLGYHDIKLKLPVETITGKSYLEAYIHHLLALQYHANREQGSSGSIRIPLAIMTSDMTHDATWEFLQQHQFFGMEKSQITLIKQEKVPCLDVNGETNELQLVTTKSNSNPQVIELVMKPHGHGDVHTLLHTSGLTAKWKSEGKQFVHFFQDTNYLILNSFMPMLGASIKYKYAFNFTSVLRKAKDASGGLVKFTYPSSGLEAIFNVEYHELDQFLRTKAGDSFPNGDVNDPNTGFSPFPGNINHFVIALDSYVEILNRSLGFVPEIFNPKFRGATKRAFTSPARLECMMQDYPKLLVKHSEAVDADGSRIGLLLFPPSLVYAPCKNDPVSAKVKAQNDIPPQCAGSAEHELFAVNREKLRILGVALDSDDAHSVTMKEWLGIPLNVSGPQIVFAAAGFAPSHAQLSSRFPHSSKIRLTKRSTLIVNGDDITFESMNLDGALRITACVGAKVVVRSLVIQNAGYEYEPVGNNAGEGANTDPIDAMRGYRLNAKEIKEFYFMEPGHYVITEE